MSSLHVPHLTRTITNVAGSINIVATNNTQATPTNLKVNNIASIKGFFLEDVNNVAEVASGDVIRNPQYPFANKCEVVITMEDGTYEVFDAQTTDNAAWNDGSKANLDQCVADLNAYT